MKLVEGLTAARAALERRTDPLQDPVKEEWVRQTIADVRERGDAALLELTEKLDGVKLGALEVSKAAIAEAYQRVDESVVGALELAAVRIRDFAARQKEALLRDGEKAGLGWVIRPLARVGIHVPGFTAALPSSVLMTAVPARVAGVGEIVLVTPPQKSGRVAPLTLVAADIAGVDRIFAIGGAQAVAALAFGTQSVPAVDKICGPGNIYVVLAKKLLFGTVGIDALQGPSEVLIVADGTTDARFCASDLLAQAEHGAGATAAMVTTSRELAARVTAEVDSELEGLATKDTAGKALETSGVIAVVASIDEAVELANLYAPEHLLLMVKESEKYVDGIRNAGCIVLGPKGTVALGDYAAGPSHVLPTGGTARFGSPLSVLDFVKQTSVMKVSDALLAEIGPTAEVLANAEGLAAHARAVELRREKKEETKP